MTSSASSATIAVIATGRRQFGVGTSRVRAASPQLRHQSCSAATCAPQRGQAVPAAGGAAVALTAPAAPARGRGAGGGGPPPAGVPPPGAGGPPPPGPPPAPPPGLSPGPGGGPRPRAA